MIVNWARWAEETQLDDRPLIMCEYSHAMGNSNGSISDYVDAFYAEPALGGGWVAIGQHRGVIVVIFATLGSEAISIISARPANARERKLLT